MHLAMWPNELGNRLPATGAATEGRRRLSDHEAQTNAAGGQSVLTDGLGCMPRVLDPCCGSRMMWFDRQNQDVVFGDQRTEVLTVTDNSRGNASGLRTIRIEPDTMLDFRALPYPDETFRLVAFDPPHLVQAGPRSWLAAKYGKLSENWRDDLRQGFAECFRVLSSDGVLVFKWNETQVKLSDVLSLTPHRPLFGNTSGKKAGTHWLVFMKPNAEVSRPGERSSHGSA